MGWVKAIFLALAEYFGWRGDKQLLDAGKALERENVYKANKEAEAKVDKVVAEVYSLDDARVQQRLRDKYTDK